MIVNVRIFYICRAVPGLESKKKVKFLPEILARLQGIDYLYSTFFHKNPAEPAGKKRAAIMRNLKEALSIEATSRSGKAYKYEYGWIPVSVCREQDGQIFAIDDWFVKKESLNFLCEEEKQQVDPEYPIDCTGDACVGDQVKFERPVYVGKYPRSRFSHMEVIECTIIKDSYGERKQQHTFTIELTDGETMRIKGRNLYKNGTWRKPWTNESEREKMLEDKHARGAMARTAREARKNEIYE